MHQTLSTRLWTWVLNGMFFLGTHWIFYQFVSCWCSVFCLYADYLLYSSALFSLVHVGVLAWPFLLVQLFGLSQRYSVDKVEAKKYIKKKKLYSSGWFAFLYKGIIWKIKFMVSYKNMGEYAMEIIALISCDMGWIILHIRYPLPSHCWQQRRKTECVIFLDASVIFIIGFIFLFSWLFHSLLS